MSKSGKQFQPAALELDELDQVTGGKGIFELIGGTTGLYSAADGKAFDHGSQLLLGSVPGVGYAYGIAQGTVNMISTGYDYSQGKASMGDLAVAASDLAVSLIPEGNAIRSVAENAMEVVHFVDDTGHELLHPGNEGNQSESHPEAGSDQGAHPTAPGGDTQNVGGQDASGSADHGAPQESAPAHDGDEGATHENDGNDGVFHGDGGHGDEVYGNGGHGDEVSGNGGHGDDAYGDSGHGDGSYFGNDFGDSNFGGGDFGGGDFGGGDFGGGDFA